MAATPSWLIELESCPSTNAWALERLAALAHGSVVFTRRQIAGRGRQGRAGAAPPGVLTISVVVALEVRLAAAVALAAGLAVVHAVEDACPGLRGRLAIKWPNDVVLAGRKLAGILGEGSGDRLVVGIGLNLAADLAAADPGLAATATSLHEHASPPDDLAALGAIRGYLLEASGLLSSRGLAALLPQLRARDANLGRSLTVHTPGGALSGIGAGIDEAGRLLLVRPEGGIAAIESGHIGW
jgi:BirA family biotin operon repressor/biotin-[acetyl-CoA-carboxylase] ligase